MPSFLSPAEICACTDEAGVKKSLLSPGRQFLLAVLAGAFIAFAAEGSNMAAFNLLADPNSYGLGRCLAGVVFPTGLMLVILAGGELFTGNTLMGIALARRRISLASMLGNWIVVYIGNFIGSVFLAHMMAASGLFNNGAGLLGGVTIKIASGKVSLSFVSAFYLGLMCNWLVCLAVWIAYGAKDIAGKVLGIFCPIWLFITSGFEHSVANMYYIPAGIFAKGNAAWAAASGLSPDALEKLNWASFVVNNLVPVTLGNIIGGMFFVGMAYWFAYLRQDRAADG
ncbi:MAG: formate/nitrite transporter family protein [Desulfovibrio sp.]|nr:formate/nitrite transporter family protein [Desulfovibrio sp.]